MIKRSSIFSRGTAHSTTGTQTMPEALAEMTSLKNPELLADLARQLALEEDVLVSAIAKFCHKAALASYLKDEDSD